MNILRKEAAAKGEKWFETGKKCKNGHIARRSIMDGVCEECRKMYNKDYHKKEKRELKKLLAAAQKNKG